MLLFGIIAISLLSPLFSKLLLRLPNPLPFYIFLAYVGFTMFIGAMYGIIAHPFFYLIGRHDLAQHIYNKIWWYSVGPLAGIKLEIHGEHFLDGWGGVNKRPCIFVVNHQSELDILLVSRLWKPHTTSCATWRVRKMPLFGWWMRLCRTIFLDPPRHLGVTNQSILSDAAAMLRRENMNLVMFPEGKLSQAKKPALLPLKRGAIFIAMEAGNLPLVPIVIANSSHVFHVPEKHFTSGAIKIRVLEPIETSIKKNETKEESVMRILEELKVKMEQTLEEVSDDFSSFSFLAQLQ